MESTLPRTPSCTPPAAVPLPFASSGPADRAWWVSVGIVALLVGYLCGGRSFAYIGLGPVYLGEAALLVFLAACPLAVLRWSAGSLVRPTPLSAAAWCLYFFLAFGLLQCLRGLAAGYETRAVLQNAVFHVYAVFLFAGVWLGHRLGPSVPRLLWFLAVCHGVYGAVYVTVLSPLGLTGSDDFGHVPWFGQPNNAAVLLVALLATESRPGRLWAPVLLNVFVLAAIQSRAEWLSLAVGAPLVAYLSGRTRQFALLGGAALCLLVVWAATDVKVPVPEIRGGGEMGGREVIGRIAAAVDPDLAATFTDDPDRQYETVSWRFEWWAAIWRMVHETPAHVLFGPGYGYPLWDLHPESLPGAIRTPHNGLMYALGYTGWTGLALFVALHAVLGTLLWRVYRRTGQPAGICFWLMCVIRGSFDNFFEAPHLGIPFYVMIGLFAAPLLASDHGSESMPQQRSAPQAGTLARARDA